MTEKYKNKYRIKSHRRPHWDYSGNGYYFITLVTQNRECNLGEIVVNTHGHAYLSLSDFGKIVDTEWNKSFEMRNELILDGYIIMPNHLHAIVIIDKSNIDVVETHGRASLQHNGRASLQHNGRASLQHNGRASLRPDQSESNPQFYRKPQSLSSFIAGFKSVINSKIDNFIDEDNLDIPKYNRNNHFFQPNYWDHIIRDENEYNRISQYIINNPVKWKTDKLNGGTGNVVMESPAEYNSEIWMV